VDHPGPWTEAEFLALGETRDRIELIDGELRASPSPSRPHQGIIHNLLIQLDDAARAAGMTAFGGADVRLAPQRIVTPDVIAGTLTWEPGVAEAADVVLACEVTSPSNGAYDWNEKMDLYAAAGIDWYLIVEPEKADLRSVRLRLHRLEGGRYVEHAAAEFGQTLISDVPFPITIATSSLITPLGC
jgi:Uma2 family endonuclease